ncbi:hypothetical protein JTE90_000673 [Oedothorax gibbosus]|uniref:Uncharacterized protein n=1 Tax=Oedothorax gibbosus TaxID=931172 RepID=A0AAV6VVJ7_9ARAC|nr:hypothetical protein JTE90_000673 [Oedothorax gibbosus]
MSDDPVRTPNMGLVMEPFQEGSEDWSTYVESLDMYFLATYTPGDKKSDSTTTKLRDLHFLFRFYNIVFHTITSGPSTP